MQHNPYLTAREVAELLKLNVETVYLLIAKEQLPAVRVGGRWRFDESELRAWLKTNGRVPASGGIASTGEEKR